MGIRVLGLLVSGIFVLSSATFAATLVRLQPETFEQYAPLGKEADAIHRDIVLQNEHLTVVVAGTNFGRNANMTTWGATGGIIDVTTRDSQSDQLTAYVPWTPHSFVIFEGMLIDGTLYPNEADQPPVRYGDEVGVQLRVVDSIKNIRGTPGEPVLVVRYVLKDGARALSLETEYTNAQDEPVSFSPREYWRMDQSSDGRAITRSAAGTADFFWCYDEWFGQAYVVQPDGVRVAVPETEGNRAPTEFRYLNGEGQADWTLAPGESVQVKRTLTPAPSLSEAIGWSRVMKGLPGRLVAVRVTDEAGRSVEGARVEIEGRADDLGWGRTDEQGLVRLAAPADDCKVKVAARGHGTATAALAGTAAALDVTLENAGRVVAHIVDEQGGPIPCKVQFNGKGDTASPWFGPSSGVHGVHNIYYSENGRFDMALDPGAYEVIVSYGPEYDAVFTEVDVVKGEDSQLEATLVRTVDTTGWISSDFHSHSSPSGDNTASQRGRVLNLLCEHVEFAPCTEHNRLDSYLPHLRALGVARRMATVTGMELTGLEGDVNHQNAFPLRPRYGAQDNGAPMPAMDPEVQISRLAYWDGMSEKVVQQNHPYMPRMFFDKDEDGTEDGGFSGMFQHMDIIEIHPVQGIYWPPLNTVDPIHERQRDVRRNRFTTWMQLWNLGRGVPGAVNTDAHWNNHGSGGLRNFIASPTDDPAEAQIEDLVAAIKGGQIVMSNGPFLEARVSAGNGSAHAGQEIAAPGGRATLSIRVQCPNWFDIDRVDVYINGRPQPDMAFSRATDAERFGDGPVKFQHEIPLALDGDAHIVVATMGENERIGAVMGRRGNVRPAAVTNPIFVDVDGQGWQPNGDALDFPRIPAGE